MKYNSNFDIDSVLGVLHAIDEKYKEGSPEDEAVRIAAVALLYIREIKKLDEYREYFRSFYTPAVDYITISKTFASREEADSWLTSGNAREGELIRVSGQGFQVIANPRGTGLTLLRTPLPEELVKKYPPDVE